MITDERYLRGKRVLAEVEKSAEGSVLDTVRGFSPDLERLVVEFGYADVFDRPGLSRSRRQLATVGALAALGNAPRQLGFHVGGALNVGCTPEEIVEALVHVSIYAGFPATLNAVTTAREVFAARGVELSTTPHQTAPAERFATGSRLLEQIDGAGGAAVVDALADIAPDLARFIVEYSFGDVYARPGLSLQERELVTVAACIALGTCVPQLCLHMHGYLNVGGTADELIEVVIQMTVYAGFPAALNGLNHLRGVLTERESSATTAE